jgi:hypothetical protein
MEQPGPMRAIPNLFPAYCQTIPTGKRLALSQLSAKMATCWLYY